MHRQIIHECILISGEETCLYNELANTVYQCQVPFMILYSEIM